MEKMIWEKPQMNEVAFAANEYVAACGDNGTIYNFLCNAGVKYGTFSVWAGYDDDWNDVYETVGWVGQIWEETNELAGFQYERSQVNGKWYSADTKLGGFHGCNEKHTTESGADFYDGYYVKSEEGYDEWGYTYDYNTVDNVKIWKGLNGTGLHATDNLDINSWETAKS